jgi:bacteriorhodopsin
MKTVARELLLFAACAVVTFAALAALGRLGAGKHAYYLCGMAAMLAISLLSRAARGKK